MTNESIFNQIAEIEREIAILPEGSITKKRIKDKDYYYLRISRDGKRVENYVSFEELPELREKINKRKVLEKRLKEFRRMLPKEERAAGETPGNDFGFKTTVRTGRPHPDKRVFKLQFPVGEFDMVVCDPKEITCKIYEVKYSREIVPEQYRHLKDEEKCSMTSHRYGDVVGRYVIYRGEPTKYEGIEYLNVEAYLKSLTRYTGKG